MKRDFSVSSKALAASPRLQKLKLSGCHGAVKEEKKKAFHSCIKLHNKKEIKEKVSEGEADSLWAFICGPSRYFFVKHTTRAPCHPSEGK